MGQKKKQCITKESWIVVGTKNKTAVNKLNTSVQGGGERDTVHKTGGGGGGGGHEKPTTSNTHPGGGARGQGGGGKAVNKNP